MMNPLYMLNRLFWLHPNGEEIKIPDPTITTKRVDVSTQLPCPHWSVGTKWEKRDPPGPLSSVWMLIPELYQAHGQNDASDQVSFSFNYPVLAHPEGRPGPSIPCFHPMPLQRHVDGLWIDFYTNNTFIQEETIKAVSQLLYLGATLASPGRPLNIFHRPLLSGVTGDNPFDSHYDPFTHSVQIADTQQPESEIRDTLYHELGHATLGHRIVQPTTPGGNHYMKDISHPGLAMSEGWAHFVALAAQYKPTFIPSQSDTKPIYKGQDWEVRDSSVPLSPNIEYNVACALWDCYDITNALLPQLQEETLSLSFPDLYRVYSPSLATIPYGPLMSDIDDYLERLIANNPTKRDAILRARDANCGYARKVALLASNQNYLSAIGEGVFANTSFISPNQRFLLEKETSSPFADGDIVHLKAFTGKYLVAESGGNSVLNANRDLPKEWETFVLERVGGLGTINNGDQVALRHKDSGYYITADPSVTGGRVGGLTIPSPVSVTVTSKTRGPSQTFTLSLNV